MSDNDWKSRLGVVFSTNPDFDYNNGKKQEEQTLPNEKQKLRIALDKRNRGGKKVTIVADFKGTEDDLKVLGKMLKGKCGVGGAVKDGEIIIQGDFRQKVCDILIAAGYKARVIG
ncbi:MAG: translation initiation factor [Rikenellaceae bacterium]